MDGHDFRRHDRCAPICFYPFLSSQTGGGGKRRHIIIAHELPFVLLPVLFITTKIEIFFYIDVIWAACYSVGYAIWAIIEIPKYHRLLKQRFSYTENIDLNWLRYILLSFFVILALWILDCTIMHLGIEAVYMLGSVTIWMFICYFIYRHESVIDELTPQSSAETKVAEEPNIDNLYKRIQLLFETNKIYLNPHLRLSDVATMTNSNRTYVSRFFNSSHKKSFFEFVNEYRINHAIELLRHTNERIEIIAEQSGFSSRQSFHRVFTKQKGITPERFRSNL